MLWKKKISCATITRQVFGFSQLAFQSRINLARFYDADHKAAAKQSQQKELSMTNWTQHAASIHRTLHAAAASPPLFLLLLFQIPYENEIFIGRLCFRYISWIVINFIDNCHILMA